MRSLLHRCVLIVLAAVSAVAADVTTCPATSQPASQPTSRPAEETVLIRVGEQGVVTQHMFDLAITKVTLDQYLALRPRVARSLIDQVIANEALRKNPDLLTREELDASIRRHLDQLKIKTLEELETRRLKPNGATMEDYMREQRHLALKRKLLEQGAKLAADQDKLRELFEKNPIEWNETSVDLYQILLFVQPWATPGEKAAVRAKLEQIRKDLVAGKLEWVDAVKQSDDKSTGRLGRVGDMPRHTRYYEQVMEVAFSIKPGEYSEVFESPLGCHLIKIEGIRPGRLDFTRAQRYMKIYYERLAYEQLLRDGWKECSIVGIREPEPPGHLKPVIEELKQKAAAQKAEDKGEPAAP